MSKKPEPLPRIHPREERCQKARLELECFMAELGKKHGLTYAEQLRVVNAAAGDFVSGYVRAAIRLERHGDTERPGGLE